MNYEDELDRSRARKSRRRESESETSAKRRTHRTEDLYSMSAVSHERICYAFPPFESSFEKKLQNILNGWTVSGDLEEEQINLKKYNLAYGTL